MVLFQQNLTPSVLFLHRYRVSSAHPVKRQSTDHNHSYLFAQGKFIFKNGRVFEGQFENDHMVDYPSLELNGTESPDSCNVRSRTPVESERGLLLKTYNL